MAQLVIRPLDTVMQRYGEQLNALGSPAKIHKVIARAANYEGRRAFVAVKRAVRRQTSIPNPIVQRSIRFIPASTKLGGRTDVIIQGTGRELSLKRFGPRQFKRGTRVKVWGRTQMYDGAFMGPRPGVIAAKLGGHVWTRYGAERLPIKFETGPSIPREMVKDESRDTFFAASFRIVDQVGKQIAAVLRGY